LAIAPVSATTLWQVLASSDPRLQSLLAVASACLAVSLAACGSSRVAAVKLASQPPAGPATVTGPAGGPSTSPPGGPARRSGSTVAVPARPVIVQDPIPFGAKRKGEMVAYAVRHYGLHSYRLVDPHVIVIHYTQTPDFQSTYNTFAPDVADSELHELPGTCAHFVIDAGGTIHQLVPLGIMCRHTVGLNWTAIGIEHVGYSDAQVLADRRQMQASLRLVRWLRCRLRIPARDVIGHNESLRSPYHHENVPSLRTQTHGDFNHADMQTYRNRLGALGGCPSA
jgi:beta-N-acetylhexosaminidase